MTTPRRRSAFDVAVVCAVGLIEAVVYGYSFPFFSLRLHDAGLSPFLIGANSTVGAAGIFLLAKVYPSAMHRLGYRRFSLGCFVLVLLGCVLLFSPVHAPLWFLARFILGVGQGGLWAGTEAWINHIAPEHILGRVTGIFATLYEIGFCAGPVLGIVIGYDRPAGPLSLTGLCLAAVLILICVRGRRRAGTAQASDDPGDTNAALSWRAILLDRAAAPARKVIAVAVVAGICETGVYTLLPVYGIERHLSSDASNVLLVAFTLGPIVLALPLGLLADRIHVDVVIAGSAALCAIALTALPVLVESRIGSACLMFLAGGMVSGIYNLALVMLGKQFTGGELPIMATAFAVAYSAGSMLGSSVVGGAIQAFGTAGFIPPFVILLTCVALRYGAPRLRHRRPDQSYSSAQ